MTTASQKTVHEIIYQYPGSSAGLVTGVYPLYRGVLSGLETDIGPIFVTSDMQGREALWLAQDNPRPLGLVVAEEIAILAELGEVPALERIGVVLAGDVFAGAGAQRRGQSGNASLVWQAFANRFAWVAGVPGNHDRFPPDWPPAGNMHLLDGDTVNIDSLRLAGLGGIIGNPRKPMRRSAETYRSELQLQGDFADIRTKIRY